MIFTFGAAGAGWLPIVGDWNGDGKDTIGLYDPATSTFYLRNTTSLQDQRLGYADVTFRLRRGRGRLAPHCRRLGRQSEGHHRPLRPNPVHVLLAEHDLLAGAERYGLCRRDFSPLAQAGAGWLPIAGDWNGDGTDTIGLYDPTRSMFFLRNTTSLQGPND